MPICECCGQKIRPQHKHQLSKGLVDTLIIFAKKLEESGTNTLHLLNAGFGINKTNNFQKLRYFGLVAKGKKTGEWVLTRRGQNFLNNQESVSKWVITKDNIIKKKSDVKIYFKQAKKSSEYWQTNFNLSITDYEVTNEKPQGKIVEIDGERVYKLNK